MRNPCPVIRGKPSGRCLRYIAGDWQGWPCEWFTYLHGVYCRVRRERFGSVLADAVYITPWPIWMDVQRWESFMSDLISKALGKPAGKAAAFKAGQDGFLKPLPTIAEFLTCTGDGKGKPRLTATLNVSFGPEGFTVCLKDRESEQVTFAQGGTLEACLKGLEERLAAGEAVWRQDRFAKPQKRS